MGFLLLDRPNPNGPHFYPTRNRKLLAIVVHVTAGLEDLDTVDDHSAENTAEYCRTTDREVSWHSGSDTDSWVDLLPSSCTAWHASNYNSSTYGHEISKKHTDWRTMSPQWVEKTLRRAAGLRVIAEANGIPIRKATRAELDREIAKGAAGQPVGFISHAEVQPQDRTDPGWVNNADTFPWAQFLGYMTNQEDEMSWDTRIENHYGGEVPAGVMLAYIDEHVNNVVAEQAAQRALLAEIANDPDVTLERLTEVVEKAVAAANAAHLAAQKAQLDAALEVVREVVGARDEDLAEETVEALGRKLALVKPETGVA